MKTTLAKYPNEPMAKLVFGDREIEMSYTFIHALNQWMAGLKRDAERPFVLEMDALVTELGEFEKAMGEAAALRPALTDAEREQLQARCIALGFGYWSSWMDEPDPFAESDGMIRAGGAAASARQTPYGMPEK